ncbi:rCG57442, isoform CRA_d [Rattus norvegicus]|uniref:RCG57442, isoform CRA_d n=1 Tax=Rattus norvegicus TaxID=10116 RepID=A6JI47_RAT|nr:rCG57442, isoform CRA_d [Rattus norvegicus]
MPTHFFRSLQDVVMSLNDGYDWIQINKFSEFDLPLVFFL